MKKIIGIMCVVFMACGGGNASPTVSGMDKGYEPQVECKEHSDCYDKGHKFCVKGICTGDPQPDVTLSDVEEDAVENDASETTDNGSIGPWGEIAYAEVSPEIKPDSGVVDTGTDSVTDNGADSSIICKMHSECDDGNACTIDECQPESEFANDYGCVFSWDEGCCLNNYDCAQGKCVGNACENECETDADCPSDDCSEASCYSGVCYWEPTNECVACTEDTGCDDGDPCTKDYCEGYTCKHEGNCMTGKYGGLWLRCETDADCVGTGFGDYCRNPHLWDQEIGLEVPLMLCFQCYIYFGTSKAEGCDGDTVCIPGQGKFTEKMSFWDFECVPKCHSNADCSNSGSKCSQGICETDGTCSYVSVECGDGQICDSFAGCVLTPECTEDSDCPEGYECLCNAPACSDGKCINVTAPSECTEDSECPVLQYCMYGTCNFDFSKFQCTIKCIDIVKIAVIWYANTYTEKLGDQVFEATPAQLCTWGWDNKPTFKFNCNNGASFWGYGDQATVACNDPNFTIKKDKELGNQGVMVVQFDKQCQ